MAGSPDRPGRASVSFARRWRSRIWLWLPAIAAIGLLIAFPPFHIVSRQADGASTKPISAAAFSPAGFAERFWSEQLQPAANRAPDIETILAELRRDPVSAAEGHARRVGLGNAAYYFARGSGSVVAVERSRVLIRIGGETLAIRTGPVFGNVVRDGCGLLDVNQVPGLAEFNALSAELNRLVEERVQPGIATIAAGATLEFAGAAEAPEALPASGPLLTFIPVQARVKP